MIRAAFAGCILVLAGISAIAQPYESRRGLFTVSEIRGCNPLTITIQVKPDDPVTGGCANFVFNPFSKDGENRPGPGTPGCSANFTYNMANLTATEKFKLTVYLGGLGANNLDDIEITIDPNVEPDFEISSCNNNKAQLLIKDKIYDQYFIDFNSPSGITTPVPSGNNPTADFSYSSSGTKNISVRGKKLNAANNCSAKTKSFSAVTILPNATIQTLTVKDASSIELAYTPQPNVQYKADVAINNTINYQPTKNLFFTSTGSQIENFSGLNTKDNPYCIRLRKFDPCDNSSSVITAPEFICSIKPSLVISNKKIDLNWIPAIPAITSYTIRRNTDTNYATTNQNLYEDNNVICKTPYCYQLTAAYPGNAKSISPEFCGTAISIDNPDAIQEISSIVNDEQVELSWIESTLFNAAKFSVRRARAINNFFTIAEVATNTYTDSEYGEPTFTAYQLGYTDVCDNNSPNSQTFSPIQLKGEVNNDNTIRLQWNSYTGYKSGVIEYQITKKDQDGNLLQTFTSADTVFNDNTPDPSNQKVSYRITALPVNPNIDESLSNQIELTRQARLIFPTAFTPDGKGPVENESFRVFGQYIRSIKLQIFDRWGTLLFSTTDLTVPWNGQVDGEDLPQSSYVWRAEIIDLLGKTFIRSGSVALLRK